MNRNPIIFGVGVAVAAAVLFLGFVQPRGRETGEIRATIEAERADLADLGARLASLEAADPIALESLADRYRGLVPGSVDLSPFLAMLDEIALRDAVKVSSVSVGVPAAGSVGGVSTIGLNVTVGGEYFAIARFLFDLEHAPRLLRVGSVSLTAGPGGGVQATLSAQIFTTDLNAGPGSDPAEGPEVGA